MTVANARLLTASRSRNFWLNIVLLPFVVQLYAFFLIALTPFLTHPLKRRNWTYGIVAVCCACAGCANSGNHELLSAREHYELNPHLLKQDQHDLEHDGLLVPIVKLLYDRNGATVKLTPALDQQLQALFRSFVDCSFVRSSHLSPEIKASMAEASRSGGVFVDFVFGMSALLNRVGDTIAESAEVELQGVCDLIGKIQFGSTGDSVVSTNQTGRLLVDISFLDAAVVSTLSWSGFSLSTFLNEVEQIRADFKSLVYVSDAMRQQDRRYLVRPSLVEFLKARQRFDDLILFVLRHEAVHVERRHHDRLHQIKKGEDACAILQSIELEADLEAFRSLLRIRRTPGWKLYTLMAPKLIDDFEGFKSALRRIGGTHSGETLIPNCFYPPLNLRREQLEEW